jgi:hypothetical protein
MQPLLSVALSPELERNRIVSLKEAALLRGISVDTLKRCHADKIVQLSPRRRGMRIRDALAVDPA